MAYIERDFPIEGLNKIAQKEGNAKKPICQINRWTRSSLTRPIVATSPIPNWPTFSASGCG